MLGTPHYMSPEQAAGVVERLDARADVWSLGVMLYELLTGTRPFSGANSRAVIWAVTTSRPQPVAALEPAAPPELAAVVERALAKRPADRYAHAGELAEELGRFLDGRLVLAHSYTARQRLGRFARRHAALLSAAAVFSLALAATFALGVRRILAERDRANREAQTAQRVASFLADVFRVSDPSEERGSSVTARELLDRASGQIGPALSQEPEVEARLLEVMGNTYDGLGLYPAAHKLLQQALDLRRRTLGPEHPDTLETMRSLAFLLDEEGHYPEAEQLYREALAARRRLLGPAHPDTLKTLGSLASTLVAEGKAGESEALGREAVEGLRRTRGPEHPDTLRAMGNRIVALVMLERYADAEALTRETLALKRRVFGPDHRSTQKTMLNLGALLMRLGRFADAVALNQELLAVQRRTLGPEHPDTLQTQLNLGGALDEVGRLAEAEALDRELLGLQRKVLGPEHPTTLLAAANLSEALHHLGRDAEGEPLLREALATQRRVLGPGHPDVAASELVLAAISGAARRPEECLALLQAAVAHGLPASDLRKVETGRDFEALRGDPRLAALLAQAKGSSHP